MNTPEGLRIGAQCRHGQLARQCEICERDLTIAKLVDARDASARAHAAALEELAAVKAERDAAQSRARVAEGLLADVRHAASERLARAEKAESALAQAERRGMSETTGRSDMDAFEKLIQEMCVRDVDGIRVAKHFYYAGMRAAAGMVNDAREDGAGLRQVRDRILAEADK